MTDFLVVMWLHPPVPGQEDQGNGDIAVQGKASSAEVALQGVMACYGVEYVNMALVANLGTDRATWWFGVRSDGTCDGVLRCE